jgi:Flp pilus assembly protein TadB
VAKQKRSSKARAAAATTTTDAASTEAKRSGTGVAAPRRAGARYTAPAPKTAKQSNLWVPVAMFTCLVLGIVVIAGNYLALLPGGEASNNFLIIGLVLLISGFVLSTFFR